MGHRHPARFFRAVFLLGIFLVSSAYSVTFGNDFRVIDVSFSGVYPIPNGQLDSELWLDRLADFNELTENRSFRGKLDSLFFGWRHAFVKSFGIDLYRRQKTVEIVLETPQGDELWFRYQPDNMNPKAWKRVHDREVRELVTIQTRFANPIPTPDFLPTFSEAFEDLNIAWKDPHVQNDLNGIREYLSDNEMRMMVSGFTIVSRERFARVGVDIGVVSYRDFSSERSIESLVFEKSGDGSTKYKWREGYWDQVTGRQ